jgi:hypothetical protein
MDLQIRVIIVDSGITGVASLCYITTVLVNNNFVNNGSTKLFWISWNDCLDLQLLVFVSCLDRDSYINDDQMSGI